jgi:glyoxylase-like metal-dependent hydrolase (beta-lactamase superfamily II)
MTNIHSSELTSSDGINMPKKRTVRLGFALLAAAVFLLTGLPSVLAQPVEQGFRQIARGVYVFPGDREKREPANLTLVVFKDFALVIDGNFPWGARERLPKIKSVTDKPVRYLFDTHYHGDHAYGNSIYVDQGATIVLSEATDQELRTKGEKGWKNWKDLQHSLSGARIEPATITFSDKLVFDDGTQRVELIRVGPAHTNGDAVAYLPKLGIVATGDLCVTWGYGNNLTDPEANYDGWLAALDRIANWDVHSVVPGHGPVAGPEALRTEREYLGDMLKQVKAGIADGKSADQLSRDINLSGHGIIAGSADANTRSVKAMFQHLKTANSH